MIEYSDDLSAAKRALIRIRDAYGGVEAATEVIGCTGANYSKWWFQDRISAPFALRVAELSGVSEHELRPDIFGPPPETTMAKKKARPMEVSAA